MDKEERIRRGGIANEEHNLGSGSAEHDCNPGDAGAGYSTLHAHASHVSKSRAARVVLTVAGEEGKMIG
jgi:hypothetical protein